MARQSTAPLGSHGVVPVNSKSASRGKPHDGLAAQLISKLEKNRKKNLHRCVIQM